MTKDQLSRMHAKGYRFRIRETDASHIQLGEPICVKAVGDISHLFQTIYPNGIFEIDDILADGSTVPLSTVRNLYQRGISR